MEILRPLQGGNLASLVLAGSIISGNLDDSLLCFTGCCLASWIGLQCFTGCCLASWIGLQCTASVLGGLQFVQLQEPDTEEMDQIVLERPCHHCFKIAVKNDTYVFLLHHQGYHQDQEQEAGDEMKPKNPEPQTQALNPHIANFGLPETSRPRATGCRRLFLHVVPLQSGLSLRCAHLDTDMSYREQPQTTVDVRSPK